MIFQNGSNISVTFVATIVLAFLCCANACFEGKCHCFEKLEVIDCTRVGLDSINLKEYKQKLSFFKHKEYNIFQLHIVNYNLKS